MELVWRCLACTKIERSMNAWSSMNSRQMETPVRTQLLEHKVFPAGHTPTQTHTHECKYANPSCFLHSLGSTAESRNRQQVTRSYIPILPHSHTDSYICACATWTSITQCQQHRWGCLCRLQVWPFSLLIWMPDISLKYTSNRKEVTEQLVLNQHLSLL